MLHLANCFPKTWELNVIQQASLKFSADLTPFLYGTTKSTVYCRQAGSATSDMRFFA